MGAEKDKKSRRRGVQASRSKLARALAEAGLSTQAALADRIADLEELDVAPRDAVSRAFREMPIDVTTLDRIAHALGVEAHTLYKTSDEADESSPPPDAGSRRARSRPIAITALILAAVAVSLWWLERMSEPEVADDRAETIELTLGDEKLAVLAFEGDDEQQLTSAIRAALDTDFTVATQTAGALTQDLDPGEVASRLRVDAVIDGELVRSGRLSAARVYLYTNGVRQQLWSDSWPASATPQHVEVVANDVLQAVRRAAGLPGADAGHFALQAAQDYYLAGEQLLDAPSSELNIKRAQSRFESSLRQDANYARAHAGLCQALLEEHWMLDEQKALEDAAITCGRALQLDADHPVVAAAHAHFLRRTGRNDEAIQHYESAIENYPNDASLLYGLSNSRLDAYRQTGEAPLLQAAIAAATRATNADEYFWKAPFGLATMHWFDGNVNAAISALEIARTRNENEMILGNLGSFYLCAGQFAEAKETYERAREVNPESYVGTEFLGQAYYFLGEFEESARLRQQAIDGIAEGSPEIHEMWGNLGESYRQAGDVDRAIAAFEQAAEIAERDYLRGIAPAGDRAARAYYYISLNRLDPEAVPVEIMESIVGELADTEAELTSASERRRLAMAYKLLGDDDRAQAMIDQAGATCPGYAKMPDFID